MILASHRGALAPKNLLHTYTQTCIHCDKATHRAGLPLLKSKTSSAGSATLGDAS